MVAGSLSILAAAGTQAIEPHPIPSYDDEFWTVVPVSRPRPTLTPEWVDRDSRDDLRRPEPTPTPRPTPRPTPKPVPKPSGPSISGKVSWYCSTKIPICHYRYPPGSMVAAAGPRLRAWFGGGERWRNKVVIVSAGGEPIRVRLVDWCQCHKGKSNEKLIDLYHAVWVKLGKPSRVKITRP